MANDYAADVLICGAGAAGLTLAIDLARRGISFRLIDKLARPFPGSRGKGIHPRTQEVFEDLGILDRIVAAGGVYPPIRDYRANGGFIETDPGQRQKPTPAEPYHIPLMIPQFLTERIMRQRLAELGGRVEFSCELVAFTQNADGIVARLAGADGEETVRVRYLVGADGGHSFVRQALGIAFPGKPLGARAIAADAALTGLDRNAWHRFNGPDMERMIMACPLAGTELFQIQAPIPAEGEVDLSPKGLERMFRERTGRADIHVLSVSWASAYAMNARLAERFRIGRSFLAGDAAHIHPPTGGQGLNTSVQDAYNLGWKLAAVLRGASEELLDSYEAERRPVAEAMLGLSARLLEEGKRGAVHRGREVQQLDIGYRASPLCPELPARGKNLRSGDRAPDAPVMGAAGQPSRLFHLFRSMGGSPLVLGIVTSAPVLGQLSDRLGRKRVLMMSQITAAGSLLLLAFAPAVAFILLARIMFGLTVGNVSVTAAYVADYTDAENRRPAMGFLMAGAGLGGIVGAGLSGLLSDISLSAPILAALGLVGISALVTKLRLEDGQVKASAREHHLAGAASFAAIAASPIIRVLVVVILCHFFAYGMYISQLPVYLGDTFVWNGHPVGAREFSYLIMADGAINILVQIFLLGWLGRFFTERNLMLLIFALICTGFITAGLATTIPALALAVLCVSTGDALAKPTYLAALSKHIPPQRQGIVLGAAQSVIAGADIVSPVLAGFILGYALYGVWSGASVAVTVMGAIITATRIPSTRQEALV